MWPKISPCHIVFVWPHRVYFSSLRFLKVWLWFLNAIIFQFKYFDYCKNTHVNCKWPTLWQGLIIKIQLKFIFKLFAWESKDIRDIVDCVFIKLELRYNVIILELTYQLSNPRCQNLNDHFNWHSNAIAKKLVNRHFFPFFFWYRKICVSMYCISSLSASHLSSLTISSLQKHLKTGVHNSNIIAGQKKNGGITKGQNLYVHRVFSWKKPS